MHSLSYTTSGDGDHTILLLHGFMGSSADWEGTMAGLGDGVRAAADLPGHGNSLGFSESSYTMEASANAVVRVLDDLGVHRASLAGYSMGGRLALYFALRHPERCEKLILESASPGLKSEKERVARRKADEEKAKRLGSGADFEAFLEEWYRMPIFATLKESLVGELIEKRRENDPVELAKSLRGMGAGSQPSLWDELENLRIPTLAVAGGMDAKFTNIARNMAEASPEISAEVVPGAGHNARLEAPGTYISFLEKFLNTS